MEKKRNTPERFFCLSTHRGALCVEEDPLSAGLLRGRNLAASNGAILPSSDSHVDRDKGGRGEKEEEGKTDSIHASSFQRKIK